MADRSQMYHPSIELELYQPHKDAFDYSTLS